MTATVPTLTECPFCGSSAEFGVVPYKRYAEEDECQINHDHGGEFIRCTNNACAASSVLIFPTMADAKPFLIERWNRRASRSGGVPDGYKLVPEECPMWARTYLEGKTGIAFIEGWKAMLAASGGKG